MIGHPRVHYRSTDSTNERARELASRGAPHGTLVTADEQTTGRGRQGRAWIASPGSAVLMSVVLRRINGALPLAAAVAVCEALPLRALVKWPNDIWIGRRKVAGVLVEGRPLEGWGVLGIGVNVSSVDFPAELEDIATSLRREGLNSSKEEVLASLLVSLDRWLERPMPEVLAAWRTRDALRGEAVHWPGGSGQAAGVDDSGALLVDTASGRIALDAGEVHLLH
ncbi:MAG: biotin--[acetyl-CoA-carboxylase] ligase [Actinomycetota bacterium]|nr:biotin--[acetyl-CoA-carboxylase] ligase [Actinomycetota bacterium]